MPQALVVQFIDDLENRDYQAGAVIDFSADLLAWLKGRKLVDDTPSVVAAAVAGGAQVGIHTPGPSSALEPVSVDAAGTLRRPGGLPVPVGSAGAGTIALNADRTLSASDSGGTFPFSAARAVRFGAGLGASFVSRFINVTSRPLSLTVVGEGGTTINGVVNGTITRSVPPLTQITIHATGANAFNVPDLWQSAAVRGGAVPTIMDFGGLTASASDAPDSTVVMARQVPFEFSAVRLGYVHLGGFGAVSGISALVGTSDDIGPGDYSLGGGSAELKKFVTPSANGVETNALSTDGGLTGWMPVTWGGAATGGVADPGALQHSVLWSDVIQLPSRENTATPGWHNLLVRLRQATGSSYTRCSRVGINVGTNLVNRAGGPRLLFASRAGDHITNPSTWTRGLTASLPASPLPPLMIQFLGANGASKTVLVAGDSRFDLSTELSATEIFVSTTFMLQWSQENNNRYQVVQCAKSGETSAWYLDRLLKSIADPDVQADDAFYLVYSVNDGSITPGILATAKTRAARALAACQRRGIRMRFVTSFPRTAMTPQEYADLVALRGWCIRQVGESNVIDPLDIYGTNGVWRPEFLSSGNHGNQACYADLARRMALMLVG